MLGRIELGQEISSMSCNPGFKNICSILELGRIDYGVAYQMQRKLHFQRVKGEIWDLLLLLEHTPTITIGKSGSINNVLVPKERLRAEGISLFFTGRGGDVTYHGPGQLVAYPIMDLSQRGEDIRQFVRDLEEVIIRTLKDFSITGDRDPSHAGVWVGQEEIGAIGLSIRNWISMHGLALNVNTRLDHFSLINPCGFSNRKATSMEKLLGHEVPVEDVVDRFVYHFFRVLGTFRRDGLRVWWVRDRWKIYHSIFPHIVASSDTF